MVRTQDSRSAAGSIAGGFVLVSVASLMVAWRACRVRPLGTGDFRTFLACLELRARRCGLQEGQVAAYGLAELAKLLGVTERRARASTRRLTEAGLLTWSEGSIEVPDRVLDPEDPAANSIGGGRGSLAIPRRMLRFLAHGARPALIATVLGLLLRCLSRRRGGFDDRGRCKVSWIASVFGVDARRVKAARRELVNLGWIHPEASDQVAENRWGRAYRIDLQWALNVPHGHINPGEAGGHTLPPLPPADRPTIATPSVDQEPLPERKKNQEPARGPAGVRFEQGAKTIPAPNLADIRPEDLRDTARTLKLFDLAAARGLVGSSEADRLKFLALAEHSRAVATVNPGGLFASLLRREAWAFVTQAEEDGARRRLRDHLGGTRKPIVEPSRPRVSTFVPDAAPASPSTLGGLLAGLAGRLGISPR